MPAWEGGRRGRHRPPLIWRAARLGLFWAVFTQAISGAHAQEHSAGPLLERGLDLSLEHCARCHVVDERDRFAGISSSPSFKIMIEYLEDWEDRFATFMARNPHPAHMRLEGDDPRPAHLPVSIKEVILSLDEIEAILAYVDAMAEELKKNN